MKNALLVQLLKQPRLAERFSAKDWELVVRQSVSAYLTASLYQVLRRNDLLACVHSKALTFLHSEHLLVERQNALTQYELGKIAKALAPVDNRVILLKGAAYIVLGLPLAQGRRISDIDILIKRNNLSAAERELIFYGWVKTKTDDYDQRYYREWMHEIPPLRHSKRGTVVDVHHNILPPILKSAPEASKLSEAALATDVAAYYVLQPIDMILHSACHLFAEGEFEKGLRDLYDLHQLFEHYQHTITDFWSMLASRSEELHLGQPLFLAMHYSHQTFGTAIAKSSFALVEQYSSQKYLQKALDYLFKNILIPHHSTCESAGYKIAKFALYWRGHLQRMPIHLLIPHLFNKSVRRLWEKRGTD